MKLHISGTPEGPDVLLLSGEQTAPEELCAALPGLESRYRLLSARGGSPEALYDALRAAGVIRLWGAYGLEEGATALLALLAEGGMEARTAVTEGPFALPAASLQSVPGTLICWKGGKDKKAKKAWAALKAQRPELQSLTLGKLKTGETYLGRRPDLMEKRLIATFGEASVLRTRDALLCPADRAWRRMSTRPAGALLRLLEQTEPLTLDSGKRTQRLQGQGGGFAFWDQLTRVESAGDGACICTDEALFVPSKGGSLPQTLARLYMKAEQRRRAALVKRS